MTNNQITKDQAYQIIEDYFIKLAKLKANKCEVTDEDPSFGAMYGIPPENEDVWYVYPESKENRIGSSRVIVVSKRTGKLLFDGEIGE